MASFTRLGSSLSQTQSARREPQLTDRRSGAVAQRRSVRFGAVLAHGVVGSNDLHMSSRDIRYNDMTNVIIPMDVWLYIQNLQQKTRLTQKLSVLLFFAVCGGPSWIHGPLRTF